MWLAKQSFVLLFLVLVHGNPKPEDKERVDRVFERELSKQIHYDNEHHNRQYDHEAFLGEEAKTFDQLSPEESRKRLGLIVDKIDNDSDGQISLEELKDWIRFTQKRYINDDVDRQWRINHFKKDDSDAITWDEYKRQVYGFLNKLTEEELEKEEEGFSYYTMLKRDRRRWTAVDADGDDILTKEQFSHFLHPEETEHLRDLIVTETIEDIDKNKDGKVSVEEYIGDMYKVDENEIEPQWVKHEREQFSTYRDKDGDGYMDHEEVKNWILPHDFDHAEAEARHLIYEADSDADQKLTKDEVLNKYDLFVGSQATDFGEALSRHDEF